MTLPNNGSVILTDSGTPTSYNSALQGALTGEQAPSTCLQIHVERTSMIRFTASSTKQQRGVGISPAEARLAVKQLRITLSLPRIGFMIKSVSTHLLRLYFDEWIQHAAARVSTVPEKCYVCDAASVECCILPCDHFVACVSCAASVFTCPLCDQPAEASYIGIPPSMRELHKWYFACKNGVKHGRLGGKRTSFAGSPDKSSPAVARQIAEALTRKGSAVSNMSARKQHDGETVETLRKKKKKKTTTGAVGGCVADDQSGVMSAVPFAPKVKTGLRSSIYVKAPMIM